MSSQQSTNALGTFAGRLGYDTLWYAGITGLRVVLGLATVAVLTRVLEPAEFGQLAVLVTLQSIVVLLANAGTLQGTFTWVLGTSGDDETGGEDIADAPGAVDRRRALTTGLVLTCAVGLALTGIVAAVAGPLSRAAVPGTVRDDVMVWMGLGGTAQAVWRLAANLLRYERRPGAYAVVTVSNSVFAVAGTLAFVAAGLGVRGALIGQSLGFIGAAVVALVLTGPSTRFAVSLHDAVNIMRQGAKMVPLVLSIGVIQRGDTLAVAQVASAATTGFYAAASRIGSFVVYWTGSFHMAWGPLRRDASHQAAERRHGDVVIRAIVATYFTVATTGVVVLIALFAPELVSVFAPGYDDAAGLIPLTATAAAMHGFFVLVYRTVDMPNQRTWFVLASLLGTVVFAGGCALLIPAFGAYGAPAATALAWAAGSALMLARSQRGPRPMHYEVGKIVVSLTAGSLAVAASLAMPDDLSVRIPLSLLVLVGFCAALIGCGVVPSDIVARLWRAMRSQRLEIDDVELQAAWSRLPDADRAVVELLLRYGAEPAVVAQVAHVPAADIQARLGRAMREMAGVDAAGIDDRLIGELLCSRAAYADRLVTIRLLHGQGLDPLDLERVQSQFQELRRRGRVRGRRRPLPSPRRMRGAPQRARV